MGLNRDELEQAIRDQVSTSHRVIETDLDAPEDGSEDAEADAAVDAVRLRYEDLMSDPDRLESAKHYALVTDEDDDRAADLRGPVRRIAVVDDDGTVEAEQG